ncbi:MAG: alcohol dehydrogenase [Flavobacteriaceae bacterium]|nr:MAG: alcohol dehydrogenase [Flavobacteriaceae bacterium]
MKAIIFENYGAPEKVLKIGEVEIPIPKDNEVLIKIYATAINDYDWNLVSGKPLLYRMMFGLLKPKKNIPGIEFSGVIERIGGVVDELKIGDAVFGDISEFGFGTFAEYICVNEKSVVKKTKELSFEEATTVPHAFALALQALKDIGQIKKNQKILINGGGGGVGLFAVQIAKVYGCHVTGVDSSEKLELMKSVGFDTVIDYKITNFTQENVAYDLVLDCKTNQSVFAYKRVLKDKGNYVTIGGQLTKLFSVVLWGKIISLFSAKQFQLVGLQQNKELDYFMELFKQKKIKSIIDGPYLFEDIPRLIQYFGKGKHKGKIVIKMNVDSPMD